jgi:hypothetical protein
MEQMMKLELEPITLHSCHADLDFDKELYDFVADYFLNPQTESGLECEDYSSDKIHSARSYESYDSCDYETLQVRQKFSMYGF